MSLWYDCGSGDLMKTVGFAKKDIGADIYLCCPGPSLANVEPRLLEVPGAHVMAVNTAYPYIRPNTWIGMDLPSCYDPRLWWEPFMKVVRGVYSEVTCGGEPIRRMPNVYFTDTEAAPVLDMFNRRSHQAKLVWNSTTFIVALHLAIWMGGRKIYLVGCDFGGDKDYYDDRKLSEEHRAGNKSLYAKLLALLPGIRKTAETNCIEIMSCTPGSAANQHLEYVELGEALVGSAGRVSTLSSDGVLHTRDAHRCLWVRTAEPEGDGVLTGANEEQEWLLPWWYDNLRKLNDTPVAFADFGLSDKMRAWCSERGRVIDTAEVLNQTWFRKPFAILASPFRRTLWMDADCEVLGDISGIFPYADKGLGVTTDPHTRFCKQPGAVASGMVACSHGDPCVEEWAKEIFLHEYRGDQEALNAILVRIEDRLAIMPRNFHRLRLDKDQSNAVVIHWSGPVGKKIIRGLIRKGNNNE